MPDHHRLPIARALPATVPASDATAAVSAPPVRSLDDARARRDLMQIGDLARETGKTVRAIHLYEELGLLNPAARSKGRFRLYGPEALLRIRWIGKLQEMGFSLGDIQTVVHEWEHVESAPSAMKRMRAVYARKLAETQAQRRRLEALEHELEASLAYLDACDICDPQRLLSACRQCDLHDREADVPELVLGFRAHPEHASHSAQCAETETDPPATRFEPKRTP
jgi:DNA-binding transcriptional MerR regulator